MSRHLDFNPFDSYVDPDSIEGRLGRIRDERRRIQEEAPKLPTIDTPALGDVLEVETPIEGEFASNSPRYQKYLRSPEWRARRRRLIRAARRRCEVCQERYRYKNLELHHITYERLFNELDEDLVVLCQLCHSSWHNRWGYGKKFRGEKDELVKSMRKYITPVFPDRNRVRRPYEPRPKPETPDLKDRFSVKALLKKTEEET